MAKTAKKDNALTPEEKLESMLVPDIEQPFSIPDNWRWVFLSSISSIISKGTTPQGGRNAYTDTGVNYLRVENICDDGTISHENIMHISNEMHKGFLKRSILQENDLLVSIAGTLGKTGLVRKCDLPLNTNQAVCFVRLVSELTLYKYIKLSLDNPLIQKMLLSQTKVTSIPNLTLEIIGNCPIPLAPYSEQQRIVDRIESLFAKLDEAREKAQAVVDGFEDRKAAILHKAFTGELTAEWRKANGILSDDEAVTIESICSSLKYGTAKKSESSGEVVVIRMGNLQQGEIDWTSLVYSNDVDDNQKYRLKPGDVLFNRTNSPELVGKTAIYRGEYPAIFAGYLIKLDYDHNRVIGEYLNYILNSPEARAYCNKVKSDGVNQSNINAKKIGAFSFRLPLIEEQQEIVSIIKTILDNDMNAKDNALQVIDHIDSMKKSILSRAFRGELGTNDPKDESAIELLKAILVEANANKSEHKPVKKKVSVPVEIDGKLDTAMERDVIKLFYKADTTAIPIRQIMSISSKKFELMEVLRSLEKKKILKKNDDGSYTLIKQV